MLRYVRLALLIPVIALLIQSCDTTSDPVTPAGQGTLILESTPAGAKIFVDGVDQSKVTPQTLTLNVGNRSIKLTLDGYADTTFSVLINDGQQTTAIIPMRAVGSMFLQSTPPGAQIWINGNNSGKITPDTLKKLLPGDYQITLKLEEYFDTTFTVNVNANALSIPAVVTLTSNLITERFGPVRIWETTGTGPDQPSGLDLSTGIAVGIGSTSPNRLDADIYYSSNGFVVRSADNATGLSRVTYFKVGTGSNLDDSADSPAWASDWASQMSDRETNYVYLYDNDQHYSKLIIKGFGGGTPGSPAWVEVEWIYNKTASDKRFP